MKINDIDFAKAEQQIASMFYNVNIKLTTPDGIGSQYVKPEKVEIEDDGTFTIIIRAWRGIEYDR